MKNFEYKDMDEKNLKLDSDNVRFFHINGYSPEESLLMIGRESIQKLINSMIKIGFDGVFPLHIDINNIVGDGNSRLLAYRIAIGKKQYEELCKKYEIQGFGKLKEVDGVIPVFQYLKNSDLKKYIRATHLVDEKTRWTTPTKYAYYYKMYVEKVEFDFPANILSVVKNVLLYSLALSISENNSKHKINLEKAYYRRIAMFERLLINTKLMNKGVETNVNDILKLSIDDENELVFTSEVNLDQFKQIIAEFGEYISINSVGQKHLDISKFPITLKILESIFKIKSTKPKNIKEVIEDYDSSTSKGNNKNVADEDVPSSKQAENIKISRNKPNEKGNSLFFIEENLSISFDELKSLEKTLAQGWRERILIENVSWYLIAKSLKTILGTQSWEFIDEGDINVFDPKYRFLFEKLIAFQETIRPLELSTLVSKFNETFKKDEIVNGKPLFTNVEQRYIKWISREHSLYADNLNQAAHGRWNQYNKSKLSVEFKKLIKELIIEFKSKW